MNDFTVTNPFSPLNPMSPYSIMHPSSGTSPTEMPDAVAAFMVVIFLIAMAYAIYLIVGTK